MDRYNLQPGGKPVHISRRVGAASRPGDGREADKHGSLLAGGTQKGRRRQVAPVSVAREGAMSTSTPSMDGPFRNLLIIAVSAHWLSPCLKQRSARLAICTHPFMVKVLDLLAKDEIFEECRAPDAGLQAGLIFDGPTDIRCHEAGAVVDLVPVEEIRRLAIITLVESSGVREGTCGLGQA